ncbi:DNA utilization protein GntX [Rhodobacteraceae bacterium THAF1]|uniref:ComF family protein n=1 Tax=Palleronia sp. THAF1 TaxID=2587842 RepID=UPI000F3FC9B3|nr:ComF family protein [Palleronia sp. THAF1]QFU10239.1 DNA utilization protein GntX [Palleronia sp. THAF1]VDC16856.1 DNA utilization protein GntX [Rhodobacteraceae bacterium THAF1]
MGLWQSTFDAIYPPTCAMCDAETETTGALCGPCWRETPFIGACLCDLCGTALDGEAAEDLRCDDCLTIARPWTKGRAALAYDGRARDMVLRLKHSDRLDLAPPAARWMAKAGAALWPDDPLLVPVPSHWTRRIKRRFDQAAILTRALRRVTGHDIALRALVRVRATKPHKHVDRRARFADLDGAIRPCLRHGKVLKDRNVVLIDDVMTSGATFAAATEAAWQAGARDVRVLALARVVKTP